MNAIKHRQNSASGPSHMPDPTDDHETESETMSQRQSNPTGAAVTGMIVGAAALGGGLYGLTGALIAFGATVLFTSAVYAVTSFVGE